MEKDIERIIKNLKSKVEIDENGNEGFILEKLTPEEKVVAWIGTGGNPKGIGEIRSFSFSVDPKKFPNGAISHYANLPVEDRYKFVQELADSISEFERAFIEGKSQPYEEFRTKNGKPCCKTCTCYPHGD